MCLTISRNTPVCLKVQCVSLAVAMAFLMATPSMAEPKAPHRTVTVHGEFKDQRITAPVRNSETGEEVLVPGGTWNSCAGDCAQALKNQTYDFWKTQPESGIGQQ